jgi:hypothetical protein
LPPPVRSTSVDDLARQRMVIGEAHPDRGHDAAAVSLRC